LTKKLISTKPLVSVGIPVFNGEKNLARALDSILNQNYSNLEIIISDNASNDGTRGICEEYVRRDSRIRYIRQNKNIGAPRNWNVVVHEASGVYFKWASANDYCAPTMIEKCVEVLNGDPGTVLCYGRTQLVDKNEKPIEVYDGDSSFAQDRPSERFANIFHQIRLNNMQCGVFRLEALRHTRLDRPYPAGDIALMAELALYGRFRLLPDILLYRRQGRDTFTSLLTPAEIHQVYNPQRKKPMKLIRTRRHMDNLASILRASIPVIEKLRSFAFVLRLAIWDRKEICLEFLSLLRTQPERP
jgi:glycosyltransferase involved in cell wall biosynthesis